MPRSIEWTAEMDERLVRLNRRAREVTLKQIAQELGVSMDSIRTHIKQLAATGAIPPQEAVRTRGRKKGKPSRHPKWTHEKLQELIDLFDGKRSDEQIGELMGETGAAIRGQVWNLRKSGRLPKGRRGYARKPRAERWASRIFSPPQDHLLIKHVQEGWTQARIAKKLGVTTRQVRTRVGQLRKLGLLPPYHASDRAARARQRRRLIIRMYRKGSSLADIAQACKSTPNAISVQLVRLRRKGEVHTRPHPRELTRDRARTSSVTTGSST